MNALILDVSRWKKKKFPSLEQKENAYEPTWFKKPKRAEKSRIIPLLLRAKAQYQKPR